MKKWLIALPAAALLTGCIAYGPGTYDPYYGNYGNYRDGRAVRDHDRDHDGVPNRYDRAPNDPRRY